MKRQKNKSQYRRGFKTWADKQAIELRSRLSLKDTSPLCAFKLAEHLEIPILAPTEVEGLTQDDVDQLLTKSSKHWSAATVPIGDNQNLILHNPSHHPTRQQSNIMHEISHVLCEHKVEPNSAIAGLSGFLRNHNDEQEREAEWLGACLQLPKPALLWALSRQMSTAEIADHFKASEQMVNYRLNKSGALIQFNRRKRYN